MSGLRFAGFLATAVLWVAAPAGTLASADAGEPKITFLKPQRLTTVLGESEIELQVVLPEGAEVEQIEIRLDGEPLTTLTAPPWKTTWMAGDGSRGRSLEALLQLRDGRRARTAVWTSPLHINQYEAVDLVDLYVIVTDGSGDYVTNLEPKDFEILENGRPQKVERFTTSHRPLNVAMVLDSSLSMEREKKLANAKKAGLEFLEVLQPDDKALVMTFNDRVDLEHELTTDREKTARAISAAEAIGGTALYDAVWSASKQLRGLENRKVLVLLSDGKDEASNGLEPGSLHTMREALDGALRAEVMIFTIGLGRHLELECADEWNRTYKPDQRGCHTLSLQQVLQHLADSTGGRALFSTNPGKLHKSFSEVANDLRHQYSIAYVSDDTSRDGKWREIKLLVPKRKLEVITRRGYYAPTE